MLSRRARCHALYDCRLDQRGAWRAVKSAMRAYAIDPSETNADRVYAAWFRLRRLNALLRWRCPDGEV